MKLVTTYTLLAVVCLLVASCATAPVPLAERRTVPHDRVFAAALLTPSREGTAQFTLVRDRGYTASGAGIDVFIDGQRVARLATSESVSIYATPGRHFLGARFSYGPVAPAEREFFADPQRSLTVRVFTEAYSSSIDLRPESGLLYQ